MSSTVLPHLETFAKAAELSSFTAAARTLGVSQAAVSQRVQALENALKSPLFLRQGGQVLLTEAGQTLYKYAQRILTLNQEARQETSGKKEPLHAELALAASSIPGEHILPTFLSRFRRRQPHVQFRVTISDSAAVLAQVERGQAALGLVGKKSTNPALEFRFFAHDRMVLVVAARNPLARRKQISIDQLCREPLIVREAGSASRECLEQALVHAGKSAGDLNVVLELSSNEAIKEMVLRGVGAAVLSSSVITREVKSRKLHALNVADLPLERDIYLVWDRRRVLSLAAQLFVDFLESGHSGPAPGGK